MNTTPALDVLRSKTAGGWGTLGGMALGAGLGGYAGHASIDHPGIMDAVHVENAADGLDNHGMGSEIKRPSYETMATSGGPDVQISSGDDTSHSVPASVLNHTRAVLDHVADSDRSLATGVGAAGGALAGGLAGQALTSRDPREQQYPSAVAALQHKMADMFPRFLGGAVGGGIPGALIGGTGMRHGADEALRDNPGVPYEVADEARNNSGFLSGLKATLPMVGGSVLGALTGAGIGAIDGGHHAVENDAAMGTVAGGVAGMIPSYYYGKNIGGANAREVLERRGYNGGDPKMAAGNHTVNTSAGKGTSIPPAGAGPSAISLDAPMRGAMPKPKPAMTAPKPTIKPMAMSAAA